MDRLTQKPPAYDVYRGTKDKSLRIATMPGAGLPAHFLRKDWVLISGQTEPYIHTAAAKDVSTQGYCFFQVVKGD